jgi:hypothetical protein
MSYLNNLEDTNKKLLTKLHFEQRKKEILKQFKELFIFNINNPRKLKAKWTVETQQDFVSIWNTDITDILEEHIIDDINDSQDKELIKSIKEMLNEDLRTKT